MLSAERRAEPTVRVHRNLQLALEEIRRYTSETSQGRVVLSWRPDGQVEMELQRHWHPPRAAQ